MFALPVANYDLVPGIERYRKRIDDRVRAETLAAFLPAFQERYLDDVGPEQGPFRYVGGSHRLMQPYEAAVRKTNDKLRHQLVQLCALPAEYGQHAIFGDHVDPASAESRALLEREAPVCDGGCDLVLFDNNGVHRGGMVRHGHRYMLQCGFKPA